MSGIEAVAGDRVGGMPAHEQHARPWTFGGNASDSATPFMPGMTTSVSSTSRTVMPAQTLERLGAGAGLEHLISGGIERPAQNRAHRILVFDQQDRAPPRTAGPTGDEAAASAACRASGR